MNTLKKICTLIFILTASHLYANSLNNELRVTLQKSKITLDSGGIRDTQSSFISRQVDCELIRSQGSTYVLEAAESINYISPLKIRIKINDKVKFHDGSSIKADDVLASFDYIKKSKNVFNHFFNWIDKIYAVDDKTIELNLKKEAPQLLVVLSSSNYPIFKKEFLEKAKIDATLWKKPLGCGGYKITEFKNNEIKLMPISQGLPIRFFLIDKNQIASKELSKYDIINLNILGKSQEIKDFNLVELLSPKQLFIGLNSKSKLWKNKYERCSFLSKVNINKDTLKKYGKDLLPANDLLPKDTFGYSKDANFNEQLIKSAKKYKNPTSPLKEQSFCLSYLVVSVQEKQKKLYLDMFKQIYPNISLKPILNVKQFGKEFVDDNCDAIIFGLVASYFDGYEILTVFEDNKANFTGSINKKLVQKIINSQYISNSLSRANEYRDIINNIADLCVVKPIFTSSIKKVYIRKNLKTPGIGLTPLHQYFLGNISRDKI
jgi:hypothetical protein